MEVFVVYSFICNENFHEINFLKLKSFNFEISESYNSVLKYCNVGFDINIVNHGKQKSDIDIQCQMVNVIVHLNNDILQP